MKQREKLRVEEKVLILTLFVQVLFLVNQTVVLAATARQTMTASMMDPGSPEVLRISLTTDTGRPRSLLDRAIRALLEVRWINSWLAEWQVGGQTRTQATVAISITVTGSNVQSSATVDYYVEAKSGANTYKFLQATGAPVTVGGAALQASDQRTIDNHLTAMGLSITQSQTVDYYVYAKATTTGAVSGETLTSEVVETKFTTVSYLYGTEVTDTYQVSASYDDGLIRVETPLIDQTTTIQRVGDYSAAYYDFKCYSRFVTINLPQGKDLTDARLKLNAGPIGTVIPTIIFEGEAADSATQVTSVTNYDSRAKTSNSVSWTPAAWVQFTWYTTPDIAAIVEEIIGRAGWVSGNALQMFWKDNTAGYGGVADKLVNSYSYDFEAGASASKLTVTYISFSASWQPLPPLSLAQLPITLDVVALVALIAATALVLRESRRRNR